MRTLLLAFAICTPVMAAGPEWALVWQDDFDRRELGPDWRMFEGQARVSEGRFEIISDGKASIMTTRGFGPDVRFEFDGGVLPGRPACDLSPALSCSDWCGRSSGYHLAFGASFGKRNCLLTHNKKIIDKDPAYRLEPNKTYHMVAIKDGAHVALSADGHELFAYDDPDPLEGPGFDRLGITTWSGIYVDNVRVYTKQGRSLTDVAWWVKLPPMPLRVTSGRLAAATDVDADEALPGIEAFNAGDPAKAWTSFSALPDSLMKAAGLAACLGHLDYDKLEGQSEWLAKLFEKLIETAPKPEHAGLRACALAARLRGDEANGRCNRIDGMRLLQLGPEHNPYYLRAKYDIARLLYWGAAEGGKKDMKELSVRLFNEILADLPDHRISRQYAGQQVPWRAELSQHPEGTPDWAAALHEAYARNVAVVEYFFQHRQQADGTMGGGIGDDVELFRSWQPLAAISTGTPVVMAGIARLCDGVWHSPAVRNGFWGGIMDVEHGAEYTADTQPVMIFLDYGEPSYYERNLETTRLIRDVFTGINQRGMRQFKSIDLGGRGIGDEPAHQADVPYAARAMKAVMWLAWAGNPAARKLFLEWSDTWLDAAMSTEAGKPAGIVPAAVWFPSGSIIRPSGNWWVPQLGWSYYDWPFSTFMALDSFNCAYHFTRDARYLIPIQRMLDQMWSSPQLDSTTLAKGSPQWLTAKLQECRTLWQSIPGYRRVSGDSSYDENIQAASKTDSVRAATKLYTRYLIDHDLAALSAALRQQTEERRYNFELHTREVLATDRAGLVIDDFFGAYTGAARRWSDMGVPSCAVTWVAPDTDFAALVQTSSERRLKLRVYQFKDGPMRLGMRLWQLQPGRYELVAGSEEELPTGLRAVEFASRPIDLRYRGQIEFVDVPPRRTYCVDVRLIEPSAPPGPQPDLAIGREDITVSPGQNDTVDITVRVHNIGDGDSAPARVALYPGNTTERALAETPLPAIPAPNDLQPRYQDVRFEIRRDRLSKGWRAVVHTERADSNPLNNSREYAEPAPQTQPRSPAGHKKS